MSNASYIARIPIPAFLLFTLLVVVSWVITWIFTGDSIFEGYIRAVVPFLVLTLCLAARHRSLSDVHTYFIVFYALHYLVMPALYGFDFVWVSFWRNEIFENWELLAKANNIAFLGLIGYSIGMVIGESVTFRTSHPIISDEFFTKKRLASLYKYFLLVGLLSWLAIALQTPEVMSSILGQPEDRLSFPRIGGAYLYMLLFAAGHSYLLATLASSSTSLVWRLKPFFLMLVLFLFLIKGARHELAILLLSFFIIHTSSSVRAQSLTDLVKRISLYGVVCVFLVSFLAFYTRYRSGLEAYAINEFGYFLHSLADSAGFMMVLLEVPSRFDYWYGMTYLYPILNHIPSAFFPDKYEYLFGVNRYTQLFYGVDPTFDVTKVSHTYSLLGEIYFNFSSYGVPIMLGLFGYINTRLLIRFRSKPSLLFRYLYALYATNLVLYSVKSGFVSGIIYYFQNVIVVFLIPIVIVASSWQRRQTMAIGAYPLTARR